MKHIETNGPLALTAFRKISLGNWRHPRDPQTYAEIELNIEPAEQFLKEFQKDRPLSLTHYVAKIIGDSFVRHPDLNSVILRGRLYRRKEVSAFISTLLKHKKGADLSGFSIHNIDRLSIHEIADVCDSEITRLRQGDDPEFHALDRMLGKIPMFLAAPLFLVNDFFKYTLNLATKSPGMQPDRFGSVIITNIGALGLQSAFTPLTPVARTAFLAAVGKPFESAVVVGGAIVVQRRVKIGFTFDHRHIDGYHGARLLRHFTKVFEAPQKYPDLFQGAGNVDKTAENK
ncbi:MAG: 2-oxo acid dehydrogenase subunit E2 [Pontiellaceae bacterium]|nr:2-oxo acid dehydrogenase subunit E2 [Pontiellaceae bacterium]MBN2785371.1 2-oxo acid dehydrogenase subunit E2 [Pontiellaceae bacterium]